MDKTGFNQINVGLPDPNFVPAFQESNLMDDDPISESISVANSHLERKRGRGRKRGARNQRRTMAMINQYFVCNEQEEKYTCRLCLQVFSKDKTTISQMFKHAQQELKQTKLLKKQAQNGDGGIDAEQCSQVSRKSRGRGRPRKVKKQEIQIRSHLFDDQSYVSKTSKRTYEKKITQNKFVPQPKNDPIIDKQLNYRKIFSSLKLHWTQWQIFNHIHFNQMIPRQEVAPIMKQYYWKYAKDYSTTFETLKLNGNVSIIENTVGVMVKNVIIRTNIMKEKFVRYKDCLGFWYFNTPTDQLGFTAIVYIIGQDRNIEPVVLGLGVILDESMESFRAMFNSFFGETNFIPEQVLVCGPNIMKYSCNQVLEQSKTKFSSLKHAQNCIYLKQNLIRTKNQKPIIIQLKDLLDSILQANKNRQASFIGFSLTQSFIEKIKQLSPDIVGFKTNLHEFLSDYFENQFIESQLKMEKQDTQDNDKELEKMKDFARIVEIKEVQQIKKRLARETFLKFTLLYIYGRFYMKQTLNLSNQREIFVDEIPDEQIWFTKPANKVAYKSYNNAEESIYVCNCGMSELIGLPCPHLIKVLTSHRLSLQEYINPRWFVCGGASEESNPIQEKSRKVNEDELVRNLQKIRNNYSLNEYSFLENLWS